MTSEAVHSLVDTTNEILLLYGYRRASRSPDESHPLGYGRELYFWSFIVALLIFALGAGVSLYQGILHVAAPEPIESPIVSFVVLGLSFLFEGGSWLVALRRFSSDGQRFGYYQAFVRSKDPPAFMVLLEDSAALVGIAIAAAATAAAVLLRQPVWDGIGFDHDRDIAGDRVDRSRAREQEPADRRARRSGTCAIGPRHRKAVARRAQGQRPADGAAVAGRNRCGPQHRICGRQARRRYRAMRRFDRDRDTQTPSKRGRLVHQAADRCSLPGGARQALRLALRGSLDVTIGTTAGTITTSPWLTGAGGEQWRHRMAQSEDMTRCIALCMSCYQTCLGTAMNHCLETGGKHVEPKHFRLMMACAEMCRTAAHFMLINTPHHRHTCGECAEICSECAEDCERVGGMDECVAMCRSCAQSCRAMAA
ncbi:hypothetical protein ACVIQY_006963 [Bradyrhizobium sp. USDA 3051]